MEIQSEPCWTYTTISNLSAYLQISIWMYGAGIHTTWIMIHTKQFDILKCIEGKHTHERTWNVRQWMSRYQELGLIRWPFGEGSTCLCPAFQHCHISLSSVIVLQCFLSLSASLSIKYHVKQLLYKAQLCSHAPLQSTAFYQSSVYGSIHLDLDLQRQVLHR